jgi:hypothetical protein
MRDSDVFSNNARSAHADAEAATLDNVRERCLRAEQAWTKMADRSRAFEISRDARVAATATRNVD